MRVLVCGDRNWTDRRAIYDALEALPAGAVVIHGACRGADQMAAEIATELDFRAMPFPARWERYGAAAGPMRNRQMLLEGKPDIVYAFHNDITKSKGTLNMVCLAQKALIETVLNPSKLSGTLFGTL